MGDILNMESDTLVLKCQLHLPQPRGHLTCCQWSVFNLGLISPVVRLNFVLTRLGYTAQLFDQTPVQT